MSKRTYGSEPNKIEALSNGKYRCLYNIEEKEETIINPDTGEIGTRIVWVCDWLDVEEKPTTKVLVPALIRKRYSLNDELERQRIRDEEPESFAEYDSYVKGCQQTAKDIITPSAE